MKSKNKDKRKLSNIEFLLIFLMVAFFALSLGGGLLWQGAFNRNAIVSIGLQETATFVSIRSVSGGTSRPGRPSSNGKYYGVYRFVDEDGTIYEGSSYLCPSSSIYIEVLRDLVVGTGIVISIDGKGNCTDATEMESMTGKIVYLVLVPFAFLAITAAFIIVFTKKKKKWILDAPERKEKALQLEVEDALQKNNANKDEKQEKMQMYEANRKMRAKIEKEYYEKRNKKQD